ncbi:hypothetical protein [Bathymodiolus thermophilus thioautotrophic gill symbiont]|uniref:hypothetical protein n=1 Tax=Bathymodiolus thermophilus thioautotrophic gill symbiont TaxID=2360 RepID=UPI0011170176|nr:hypothetical protein [Bathymodiolus thermophilus thioautotrophic gill symbiont]
MNNYQESSFYPLGNFLNPALALLGQGLRKLPSGQKLNFANHPYLCKGLTVLFILFLKILQPIPLLYPQAVLGRDGFVTHPLASLILCVRVKKNYYNKSDTKKAPFSRDFCCQYFT